VVRDGINAKLVSMKTRLFIVIESQGNWWVDCEGKAYGPLPNRDGAIQHALKIAETFTDSERQPQVWTTTPGERPTMIWAGPEGARDGRESVAA